MGICPDTAEMRRSSSNSWSLPPCPPTTKLGLWETISFLFYYRSFLLKGYVPPPSLVGCPQGPKMKGSRFQGHQAGTNSPRPWGHISQGEIKLTLCIGGIKAVNVKSELEIHDNVLTISTDRSLKGKFPPKSFRSIGGSS